MLLAESSSRCGLSQPARSQGTGSEMNELVSGQHPCGNFRIAKSEKGC